MINSFFNQATLSVVERVGYPYLSCQHATGSQQPARCNRIINPQTRARPQGLTKLPLIGSSPHKRLWAILKAIGFLTCPKAAKVSKNCSQRLWKASENDLEIIRGPTVRNIFLYQTIVLGARASSLGSKVGTESDMEVNNKTNNQS